MNNLIVPGLKLFWLLLFVALIPISCRQVEPAPGPGPEPESFPAQVPTYDLGETTILQDQFPEESPFRHMPVRLTGIIGVPESDGQHPVVLIMHGSHVLCLDEHKWPCDEEQKNYEGFAYLVEELARAGYVAISINVNAEHTDAFGEGRPAVRTKQLIDLHLGELAAATAGESDSFGLDLTGRVDLSKVVWIGHSRGAEYASRILRDYDLPEMPDPVGYGPVQGLIQVAPALVSSDSLPVSTLPLATILSACDQDFINLDGQAYYESARFEPERRHLATAVYFEGAIHNYFNTNLDPEFVEPIANRPDCAPEILLPAEAQQEFLVNYTIDFLQTLYAEPESATAAYQRLGILPSEPAPEELYGVTANITLAPAKPDTLPLIRPESVQELVANLLGGEVQLVGLQTTFCPAGYYVPESAPGSEPCKRVNINQPGNPQQFAIQWDGSGAELRTAIPESAADWSHYVALQLRVALDPLSELNVEDQPQSFTVELVDGRNRRSHVTVSDIEYPPGVRLPNDYFEGDSFSGHVTMPTVRIPLEQFEGIDLENIVEIVLLFDQTQTGALFVADLELVKSDI